jgi:hypothetical protein
MVPERHDSEVRSIPLRHIAMCLALALGAGCSTEVRLVQPPPRDTTGGRDTTGRDTTGRDTTGRDTTGGTVQRATLVVRVVVDTVDTALARTLGWGPAVPGTQVVVERIGTPVGRWSATVDSLGEARFPDLLTGDYRVSAVRILTAAEKQTLPAAAADVDAFGGYTGAGLRAAGATAAVAMLAGRRGSLVISEWYTALPFVGEIYYFGTYLEIYNNSDTTIYLDGKIVGEGPPYTRDATRAVSGISCADGAPFQLDPDGLWSRWFEQIPGSGRQYPLAPGQAVVLATDAIDHRTVHRDLQDLSGARFESKGTTDPDNPGVPNLRSIGPAAPYTLWGHGMIYGIDGEILFVSDAVDVISLPRSSVPGFSVQFARIPRASVLDVLTTGRIPDLEAVATLPLCPQLINPAFDLQAGLLWDYRSFLSVARKVFTTLPDGRVILLRTRSTANDFVDNVAPSPGRVP